MHDRDEGESERRKQWRRRVSARIRERRMRERTADRGRGTDTKLTILAILSVALALIGEAFGFVDLAPRQLRGVVVGLLLAGAALLAARLVTPRAWATILERSKLLLPLGLVTGIVTMLGLAFGVLAVAVKLHVATELEDPDFAASATAPGEGWTGGMPARPRRPPPGIAVRRARRRRRLRGRTGPCQPLNRVASAP